MTVLLVGCGRMGSAMARGWQGSRRVLVHDPMVDALPAGAEAVPSLAEVESDGDLVVVLAVKPQIFGSVAAELAPLAEAGALFVSIMAGKTLAGLGEALGGTGRVVRVMPNTPAAIGKGISGAVAAEGLREGDREAVEQLLAPTGDLVWLGSETEIDAVTALSGSGPAYFFRFAEALAAAGAEAGLPRPLAMRLARATLVGAGALAEAEGAALPDLRKQVTSPGGTTAAGLAELDKEEAIDRLLQSVVDAAAARSRELAG